MKTLKNAHFGYKPYLSFFLVITMSSGCMESVSTNGTTPPPAANTAKPNPATPQSNAQPAPVRRITFIPPQTGTGTSGTDSINNPAGPPSQPPNTPPATPPTQNFAPLTIPIYNQNMPLLVNDSNFGLPAGSPTYTNLCGPTAAAMVLSAVAKKAGSVINDSKMKEFGFDPSNPDTDNNIKNKILGLAGLSSTSPTNGINFTERDPASGLGLIVAGRKNDIPNGAGFVSDLRQNLTASTLYSYLKNGYAQVLQEGYYSVPVKYIAGQSFITFVRSDYSYIHYSYNSDVNKSGRKQGHEVAISGFLLDSSSNPVTILLNDPWTGTEVKDTIIPISIGWKIQQFAGADVFYIDALPNGQTSQGVLKKATDAATDYIVMLEGHTGISAGK